MNRNTWNTTVWKCFVFGRNNWYRCIPTMIISITTVIQYIYKYKFRWKQADSIVSGTNGLLTSDFGSSTWGERHNSYYANHPQRAAHLVMFKISVCKDPKNLTTSSTAQIELSFQWQKLNSLPPWSNLNWLFQNPQILRTISSGHGVIHTPDPFSVWCLLWQWWLSYPLRTSVAAPNDCAPGLKRIE